MWKPMDHPPIRERTHARELRREYFSLSFPLSLRPRAHCLSLTHSLSLSVSLALCTDANETTADLRDIYVRFSRTLLLARRAFVDDDRVDAPSRSFLPSSLSLSLARAPAPRSLFALTRERRGPSPSRFFALSLSLSFSLPAVSAPVHMRVRPRKHETRVGDGGALERARLSPLMQNTYTYACERIHSPSLRRVRTCTRARPRALLSVSSQPAPYTAWRESISRIYSPTIARNMMPL